jgi:hypothetical protein
LRLDLVVTDQPATTRRVRLWPVAPELKAPPRKLVTADSAGELEGLIEKLPHKRFNSCESIPDADCRFVVAPAAAGKITSEQAKALAKFVTDGGELVIIGSVRPGIELLGIKSLRIAWPVTRNWTANARAPLLPYLSVADFVAPLARLPQAPALQGGRAWLSADGGELSLVSEASSGQGRLLWMAWPDPWSAVDPRSVRVVALALGEVLALSPKSD